MRERERLTDTETDTENWLVSRYFESSQLQRITSGLTTNFKLSLTYSVHKSSNHRLSQNHKVSPATKKERERGREKETELN